MNQNELKNKAIRSLAMNDQYLPEDAELYHGYVIDKNDEKAFQSKDEVNQYLNNLLKD